MDDQTIIYNYHPETKEFIGEGQAEISPLDDMLLIPAFATTTEPPDIEPGNVAVFDDGVWTVKTDNRGRSYWLPDGQHVEINELGVEIPSNALSEKPDLRTLDEVKSESYAAIELKHAEFLRELTGNPTDEESKTWPTKSAAAYAFVEGTANTGQMKFLNAAAAQTGVDASVIANRIIAKSEPYLDLVGRADGFRATAKQSISTASTPQEVQRVLEVLEISAKTEAASWIRQYARE